MKVVLLVVRCMIPARKLLHAQTVPKAVLIFRCITTLQKNTKIVSTHVKMASGVIPVPQSLVKDALKMLKYFAWQQNTVIITILQYTAILHMRSLAWTTTVSAVNVIWCFITKMKRSGEFCDHVFHHFGPSPRRVVSTGRRMNICLCVCFSTDVYLWWEASVRLGELSSGWCFWFWYRKGVARCSSDCSFSHVHLLLFKAQSFKSLLQASLCRGWDLVGVIHFHYMANVCISISPGVHGRDCCSFQDGVLCISSHKAYCSVSVTNVFVRCDSASL